MIDIPLDARVECTDGKKGKTAAVVVSRETRKVTHIVVKDRSFPGEGQVMVSIGDVAETSHDWVKLNCTKDQLARMMPFSGTHYVERDLQVPEYHGVRERYYLPYVQPVETFVTHEDGERVPAGKLAVHRGTEVNATDGQVGKVAGLLLDEESGEVTHMVLEEGHLWGKKDVALPLTDIDRVEDDVVYLNLDKKTIGEMPAVR